jgi:hypothetical protein
MVVGRNIGRVTLTEYGETGKTRTATATGASSGSLLLRG